MFELHSYTLNVIILNRTKAICNYLKFTTIQYNVYEIYKMLEGIFKNS